MSHGRISKGILYKTKEIIIALRTSYQQHVPLAIWNSQVETVLGSSSDIRVVITSSDDNTVVIMEAQQRLHSLCRLKKVDLPILVLTIFHRGTINWRRNRELLRKLLPHMLPHIQDI